MQFRSYYLKILNLFLLQGMHQHWNSRLKKFGACDKRFDTPFDVYNFIMKSRGRSIKTLPESSIYDHF